MIEFLRLPAVLRARADRSKTQHYEDVRRGLFTPGVWIARNTTAWPAHEVEAINRACLAGQSDEEIRELVKQLVAARENPRGEQFGRREAKRRDHKGRWAGLAPANERVSP
jgi:prophage regulatory protein